MASLLKASNEIRKEAKGKGKGKADESTEVAPVKLRKDKVLMLCSRGVTQRHRHLMRDLEVLLPHTKKGEYGVSILSLIYIRLISFRGPVETSAKSRLQARHEIIFAPDQRAGRFALM